MLPEDPPKLWQHSVIDDFIISTDQESLLLLYVAKSKFISTSEGFKVFNPTDPLPAASQIIFILKLLQFHQMRLEMLK